jgi:hypothetical protein
MGGREKGGHKGFRTLAVWWQYAVCKGYYGVVSGGGCQKSGDEEGMGGWGVLQVWSVCAGMGRDFESFDIASKERMSRTWLAVVKSTRTLRPNINPLAWCLVGLLLLHKVWAPLHD